MPCMWKVILLIESSIGSPRAKISFQLRNDYIKTISTSYYPRSTTDVWKGYFYKHQVDFFGSRRCLRRPGFDSYFAPIIKFIRPDYYQCFLSNRDIMVFFGQLWLLVTMHWFYAKRQTKAEKAGEKDDSFHISVSWCCWVAIFKKIWAPKAKCQTFFYVHWNTPNHSNLYFSLLESSAGKHPLPFFSC